MCLIEGQQTVLCTHPTCIESRENPDFYNYTRSAIFLRTSDFSKVTLYQMEDTNQRFIRPKNPHSKQSDNWRMFEKFKEAHKFYAVGIWPDKTQLKKTEVRFKYFLFGRRVPLFDPLTETESYDIILDVEEAAVYAEV